MIQSTENEPVTKEYASKLASVLEGLVFPADKAALLLYLMQKPSNGKNHRYLQQKYIPEFWEQINFYDIENLLPILQNNLTDNQKYSSPYEIEKKAGLLQQKYSGIIKTLTL